MTLFALKALEFDMGWLLTEEILSLQTGRQIPNEIRQAHPFALYVSADPAGADLLAVQQLVCRFCRAPTA